MRLKEIKPGMYIYCKNLDELKALLAEANRLGYRWADGTLATNVCCTENASIKFHSEDTRRPYKYITWGEAKEGTEFSDLILPELTAEEALRISTEICNASDCDNGCPLAAELDDFTKQCMICPKSLKTYSETIPIICAQWKADHEKKEPEIETVDICRIIEIQPDGRKRCVHEEDIKSDPELPYGSEQIAVHEILKRYCMEHDGEFIAVHEVVSRVKR